MKRSNLIKQITSGMLGYLPQDFETYPNYTKSIEFEFPHIAAPVVVPTEECHKNVCELELLEAADLSHVANKK